MELKNPIEEARRYMDNAKEILKEKAVKDGSFYTDSKYVKMAGHTMWAGCLLALDFALDVKKPKNGRKDIDDYKAAASKVDKKLLSYVVEGYNTMHLSMSYDGNKLVKVVQGGFEAMKYIIDWCEKRTKK
jgi:hypothetical protein